MQAQASKHYLVTGGCGFIGSHLVDALIGKGHHVTILDDLSTGKAENAHPNAQLIVGDATDHAMVERAMRGIDGCFHLAAVASVEKSTLEWAKAHAVNVTATVNVLQAASRSEPKIPVVYTSSAAVYGESRIVPIPEHAEARPLTAYGADKLGCDLHGQVAWRVHNVPTIGLRPFNVYGPRQDPSSPYSGVISIFFNRMQRGLPITIYGDGMQLRDFVYVSDAAATFMTAMEHIHGPHYTGHDIFNICTGRSTSVSQLADTIGNILGRYVQRDHGPARKGDIRVSLGNPAKLFKRLGLKLNVTLHEGLRSMQSYTPAAKAEPAAVARMAYEG